jgi:hypothetical protein
MEPLKPETASKILEESPEAAPEDVQEYERLLAERFTVDPDLPMAPEADSQQADIEERIQYLYRKLFPPGNRKQRLLVNYDTEEPDGTGKVSQS